MSADRSSEDLLKKLYGGKTKFFIRETRATKAIHIVVITGKKLKLKGEEELPRTVYCSNKSYDGRLHNEISSLLEGLIVKQGDEESILVTTNVEKIVETEKMVLHYRDKHRILREFLEVSITDKVTV